VPGGEVWRRARLLAALLRTGVDLPAEVWLEALEDSASPTDLMLALRTLGVVRTADVARLRQAGASDVVLPLTPTEENDEPGTPRVVAASEIERFANRAADMMAVIVDWPEQASAVTHLDRVMDVLGVLGWAADSAAAIEVRSALASLAAELPASWPLSRAEFVDRTRQCLETLGEGPAGGCGGGVQLLSAMEARGRTFEHLFLTLCYPTEFGATWRQRCCPSSLSRPGVSMRSAICSPS
jgi:hypothetical protein